ncbi:MAG: gfo/Idh/MocA family oxidoreductase [Planctomycetaceae bacterium]|nr:MAG: gfo/Idh/MocA family oxidoreductase [Planctomycetaceae bacterium]
MAHAASGPQSGMNYAPSGLGVPVCEPGSFRFAAAGLDHGHIFGMTLGLVQAGGTVCAVFDPDPTKVAAYRAQYPEAHPFDSLESLLGDDAIQLVCCAAVPDQRADIGVKVLESGKHFLADKPPFTNQSQLDRARETVRRTGKIWAVYYSERLHNEAAVHAGSLIRNGAIGRVLNVVGLGPHRLNAATRPPWFFERARYGGILADLASHQIEQFLAFAGADDAAIIHSAVANFAHPEYPELEDFGEVHLITDSGVTGYFRVDWFTPDGLGIWGDGRVVVLGTDGYFELRKYIDVAGDRSSDHIFLVDRHNEHHLTVHGTVGFPFFGQLILDCIDGTHHAMDQTYTFRVAELSLLAQEHATVLTKNP